jgi:hypothetical protein
MTTTTTTTYTDEILTLAIIYLDAEHEQADSYVYRDDATRKLYRVSHADMVQLGRMLDRSEPDAYSVWCSCTLADEVIEA